MVLAIGDSPSEVLGTMVTGAVGSSYAWGYTLYYATSFIFTGLAVTVAFHASLFNIGGEGQAQLGGLGVALVCLALPWPHWTLALPAAMLGVLRSSARPGRRYRPGFRPGAAATSSSPRSCSTTSARR